MSQTAQQAYARHHATLFQLSEQLTQAIEDMEAPSDLTNWAHVGSAGHFAAMLADALEFFTGVKQ